MKIFALKSELNLRSASNLEEKRFRRYSINIRSKIKKQRSREWSTCDQELNLKARHRSVECGKLSPFPIELLLPWKLALSERIMQRPSCLSSLVLISVITQGSSLHRKVARSSLKAEIGCLHLWLGWVLFLSLSRCGEELITTPRSAGLTNLSFLEKYSKADAPIMIL